MQIKETLIQQIFIWVLMSILSIYQALCCGSEYKSEQE